MKKKVSPEFSLLLNLTRDIYKRPIISFPERVNWHLFTKLALDNNVLYYVLTKVLENNQLKIESETLRYMTRLKDLQEKRLRKLRRTLELVNEVLGDANYLLLNTYKAYPYVTHDLDLIVSDTKRAERLFNTRGFRSIPHVTTLHEAKPRDSDLIKEGFLALDLAETEKWGSIVALNKEILWLRPRKVTMCGVETRVPTLEGDLWSILAHTNFHKYQITLGDLLYVYKLSAEADWSWMAEIAAEQGGIGSFMIDVIVLNSLHHTFYGEPSPIEEYVSLSSQIDSELPYTYSFSEVTYYLMERGVMNLVKLPSYFYIRLKKRSPKLAKAYLQVVVERLGRLFIENVYY